MAYSKQISLVGLVLLGVIALSSAVPEVSVNPRSSLGVNRKADFRGRGGDSEVAHEEGSAVADVIVLGLPVLFLPALLLALLYLVWGGLNSSHNYHNYKPAYGIGLSTSPHGGPGPNLGGVAGPGSGYHCGPFKGAPKFTGKEDLARSIHDITPRVFGSLKKHR